MEVIMLALGYISGIFMGVVLGLLGGGGSILTVPIITYLFSIPATVATSYSLFIVGVSAAIGASSYVKKGLIEYKVGGIFAVSAFLSIYLVRQILLPSIPDTFEIFNIFEFSKDNLVMLVFSIVMLGASFAMIRGKKDSANAKPKKLILFILQGLFVGAVTGFVGAGGGFLIIPGLVFLAGLEMKKAVGTSLFVISINSLFGFSSDLISGTAIDWVFLLKFTGVGILGVFIGTYLSNKISNKKLKPLFGWFVLVAGISIIIKEIL
ncbi:MAG: sulfite exporter TauE/SafE family protein [Bacteriovoracaceae bacterium]|nr:sulfite exporter TauE/SafE family protein [Bacteriovoracaceae bacterium]